MAQESYKPVMLSLLAASREFGISRNALKQKLTKEAPGEDGTYSILQLAGAIYGDIHREKLKLLQAHRQLAERKLAAHKRQYLDAEAFAADLADKLMAVRQTVEESHVDDAEMANFMHSLRSVISCFENAAARSYKEEEEEGDEE